MRAELVDKQPALIARVAVGAGPSTPAATPFTDHEQTDARVLAMFSAVDSPDFDTEDARAVCRLFAACVRAAQVIMFEKTFRRGSRCPRGSSTTSWSGCWEAG